MKWWRSVFCAAGLVTTSATITSAQRAVLEPSRAFGGAEVIHESWSAADGLPVNSINHLIQSKNGYIWAATFDGLVRFDGVRFTVFNSANSPGLPSNRIVRLEEAPNGDLWLHTEQGHFVRFRGGRFTSFVQSPCVQKFQFLVHRANGTTWIATCTGLGRVVGDSLMRVGDRLIGDSVIALATQHDGTLLIGRSRRGLLRLRETPEGTLIPVSVAADTAIGRERVNYIYERPEGGLLVATGTGVWTDRGGWRLLAAPRNQQFFQLFHALPDPEGRGTILYGQLKRDDEERAAGVYLGVLVRAEADRLALVDSSGLFYHDPPVLVTARALWHGSADVLYRNGLPVLRLGGDQQRQDYGVNAGANIMTMLADREGSIWMGTYANGLHRIKPTLVRTLSEPDGLRARNVYGVYRDRQGTIWVGSAGLGASRIDPPTGRIDGFGGGRNSPFVARTFLEDRNGTMWIGSGDAVTGVYACASAPRYRCTPEAPPTPMGEVYALFEDADGRIWVGARNGVFRRDGQQFIRLDSATGAPTAIVRAFAATRDGAVWMGTNGGGIVRYRDGVFTSITTRHGLPSDLVRALHVDRDGMLWIGTEGRGLARLNPTVWTSPAVAQTEVPIGMITSRNGLFDDGIHEILADDNDRLWMSTNRGIFWLARREAIEFLEGKTPRVHSTGYTERDGMRNREGNGGFQPSGARSRDGRLWFATQDGVAVVNPKDVASDSASPPLVIEQVVAGDSEIANTGVPVRLSPQQRDIRVDFTALTFLEPRNVHFRYRLDPYNDEWVDSDTRRSAFFTKLPPGRYTFRVQASNPGQEWRDAGVQLEIVVVPQFFETIWFRTLSATLLVVFCAYALRSRSREARRRARDLERQVNDRTLALRDREQQLEAQNRQLEDQAEELQLLDDARNRFFANVSHELRTPLTLMIAPLDRLREQQQVDNEGQRWLDLAQRNARRLLELVNQMLDVARLEAGAMRLTPRNLDLSALLRGSVEGFRLTAERKNVKLLADVPQDCSVTLDSDSVEKIVSNLLSNAVKFTPPGGFVSLELRAEKRTVVIAVANTGPAIPPEKLALLFERFYQVDESLTTVQPGTGIGLSLVKELVELQSGTVSATSDAGSTTFVVRLPVPERLTDESTTPSGGLLNSGPILVDATAVRDEREVDVPTLLVVDDSDDMRSFIKAHFDGRFRVLQAENGTKALDIARSQLPDVIVSDVMMPGLDGRELVRALRSSPETDYLAIILLTAQAESEQRIAGLEGGADDYLAKPFEMRELDVRVRNLIAARRRLQLRFGAGSWSNGSAVGRPVDPVFVPASGEAPLGADDLAYRGRVLDAIRARMGDADFGVAELADDMAQDRSHLFRRVRQVTGLSPSDLLRRMRVEESARLLLLSSGSVADVAFSVGFRSVSHFFRCFNERYGVTPSEYRASANVGGSAEG